MHTSFCIFQTSKKKKKIKIVCLKKKKKIECLRKKTLKITVWSVRKREKILVLLMHDLNFTVIEKNVPFVEID